MNPMQLGSTPLPHHQEPHSGNPERNPAVSVTVNWDSDALRTSPVAAPPYVQPDTSNPDRPGVTVGGPANLNPLRIAGPLPRHDPVDIPPRPVVAEGELK